MAIPSATLAAIVCVVLALVAESAMWIDGIARWGFEGNTLDRLAWLVSRVLGKIGILIFLVAVFKRQSR